MAELRNKKESSTGFAGDPGRIVGVCPPALDPSPCYTTQRVDDSGDDNVVPMRKDTQADLRLRTRRTHSRL